MITDDELGELATLHVKAQQAGCYWTDAERDRVRALTRKRYPGIQFAPSTDEIARRFGRRSHRERP